MAFSRLNWFVVPALAVAMPCSGGLDADPDPSTVRFGLFVEGWESADFEGITVESGRASNYLDTEPGESGFQVSFGESAFTINASVAEGMPHLLALHGTSEGLAANMMQIDEPHEDARHRVRFAHLGHAVPVVEIYVVERQEAWSDSLPVVEELEYQERSQPIWVGTEGHRIVVVDAATDQEINSSDVLSFEGGRSSHVILHSDNGLAAAWIDDNAPKHSQTLDF